MPPFFSPKWVKYIFLVVDVVSFLVQTAGGGMRHECKTLMCTGIMAVNSDTVEIGSRITLFGLSVSLAVFVFFLFLCIYLHIIISRQQKEGANDKWKVIFYVLYFDMILLTIRSIYRVAEYATTSFHNSISLNESLFYGLDIVLMIVLLLVWIPFHPGLWDLVEEDNEKTQELETKESVTRV